VVAQPNDWQKAVKAAASTARSGGRARQYSLFWTKYLDQLRSEHPAWSRARTAPAQNWFPMSAGIPGLLIVAAFAANSRLRHELYIDRATAEECKALFDHLFEQRDLFEQAYGRPLEWERLDNGKACRIAEYVPGDVGAEDKHAEFLAFFDDAGTRLRAALGAVDLHPQPKPGDP
jgi:hypothetical protein